MGKFGLSFSLNRALGITRAKQRLSRSTGIPLTKAGRQRKIGKLVTGGGCLVPTLAVVLMLASACAGATPTPESARPPVVPTVTPVSTYTPQPTYTPYPTNTPYPKETPVATSVAAVAVASPTPAPRIMYVCADGEGVYLRSAMDREKRTTLYSDGTQMTVLSFPASDWAHVRTPDGANGYIPAEYLCGAPKAVEVKPTAAPLPFAPVVPVSPPTATSVPAPPTVASPRFLSVNGASLGGTASVSVQTAPGAMCTLVYVTPSGSISTAQGVGSKYADANGQAYWSWKIATSTHAGTGTVRVTCGGVTITSNIRIG